MFYHIKKNTLEYALQIITILYDTIKYTGWFIDSGLFEMLITPLIFELSL